MEYAKYSGLAMNFKKTKVIWFGCVNAPSTTFLQHLDFEWNPSKFSILGIEFTRDLKNISDLNIQSKLVEMQKDINNWSKRDLTPFGKIVVIRSLIISKIVHILMSLPTPSKNTMLKINKLLYDFLWDGKPEKIKRNMAKQKLEKGGLNMIDIDLFDRSLKLTWIRRLICGNQKWKYLICFLYPEFKDIENYGNVFIKMISDRVTNPFWSDVLKYLYDFITKYQISCFEELYSLSFHYNSNFKIGKNVIDSAILRRHGIYFIYQLMKDSTFLSCEEFNQEYGLQMDFLTYHSIIKCIKVNVDSFSELEESKKTLKRQPAYSLILKDKKGASSIYQNILTSNFDCKGKTKWIQQTGILEEDWFGSFALLKKTTSDTKLRWLQFRVLHSILTTNRSVSKYKNEQSDLCHFCNIASESIQHLLWQCEIVNSFWKSLCNFINKRCKHSLNIKIDEKLALFGFSDFIFTDRVFDLILLLTKLFIYKCKAQDKTLNLKQLIQEIYKRYSVEKFIRKNSIKFQNEWMPYIDLFKGLI